jgi:hypothetical protein
MNARLGPLTPELFCVGDWLPVDVPPVVEPPCGQLVVDPLDDVPPVAVPPEVEPELPDVPPEVVPPVEVPPVVLQVSAFAIADASNTTPTAANPVNNPAKLPTRVDRRIVFTLPLGLRKSERTYSSDRFFAKK